AILSQMNGATITPSIPVVQAANVPWMMMGTPFFAGIDKLPFLFVDQPTSIVAMQLLYGNVKKTLGATSMKGKRLFVMLPTPSPANDERLAAIRAFAKKDGVLVTADKEPILLSSWTSQAANLMTNIPDAVI